MATVVNYRILKDSTIEMLDDLYQANKFDSDMVIAIADECCARNTINSRQLYEKIFSDLSFIVKPDFIAHFQKKLDITKDTEGLPPNIEAKQEDDSPPEIIEGTDNGILEVEHIINEHIAEPAYANNFGKEDVDIDDLSCHNELDELVSMVDHESDIVHNSANSDLDNETYDALFSNGSCFNTDTICSREQHKLTKELSCFERYMSEVRRIPQIKDEEYPKLWERVSNGDSTAKEYLFEGNLRLVAYIVTHSYAKFEDEQMDIIQEGNLGLWRAIEKYDNTLGASLSTYAAWWIRQSIHRYLANNSSVIRMPVQSQSKIRELEKIREKFIADNGYEPSDEYLASVTEYTERTIASMRKSFTKGLQLSGGVDFQDGYSLYSYCDKLFSSEVETPDLILERKERKSITTLLNECKSLTKRQRDILVLRYIDEFTLEKVSIEIGRTRERVRQIQVQATKNLFEDAIERYAYEILTPEDYKLYQQRNKSLSELSESMDLSLKYICNRLKVINKELQLVLEQEYDSEPFYKVNLPIYNFNRLSRDDTLNDQLKDVLVDLFEKECEELCLDQIGERLSSKFPKAVITKSKLRWVLRSKVFHLRRREWGGKLYYGLAEWQNYTCETVSSSASDLDDHEVDLNKYLITYSENNSDEDEELPKFKQTVGSKIYNQTGNDSSKTIDNKLLGMFNIGL